MEADPDLLKTNAEKFQVTQNPKHIKKVRKKLVGHFGPEALDYDLEKVQDLLIPDDSSEDEDETSHE
jgi:hypothetical protein